MTATPLRLGVNIDHVATVRQARGGDDPDVLAAARAAVAGGADGLTVHLREDRRHIQDADVFALREQVRSRLNLELAATSEMVAIACRLRPPACCVVPERRAELTTEGGLDVAALAPQLAPMCATLAAAGIEVSLFVDPDPAQIAAAAGLGVTAIELHTGQYAQHAAGSARESALATLRDAAREAAAAGLVVNAGHGLNYDNVGPVAAITELNELNIGHAIVARALFTGLEAAVGEMLTLMHGARA